MTPKKITKPAAPKKSIEKKPVKKTKSEMRIAIAKDVLKLLNTRRLTATPGTYLQSSTVITEKDVEKDRQFGAKLKNCRVCALGAMFVAEVDLNDRLGCKRLFDEGDIQVEGTINLNRPLLTDRLKPFFSMRALSDIERAFEDEQFWQLTYPEPKKRLAAIMANIIRSAGTFKIDAEPASSKPGKAPAV